MRHIHRFSLLATLAIASVPASAQQRLSPEQQADSDALRAIIKDVPLIPVDQVELRPSTPLVGISAIAVDGQGNIYVIHRPTEPDVDPVVVLDPRGNVLRSWGKGMFNLPHGIRIDPAGNVWTMDANSSKVYKFTPMGEKLLEIVVGGIPDASSNFCSVTDIAFSPTGNGHVYVADGYCNSRVVEYDANGTKITEWGGPGTGPGEFDLVHGIAVGPDRNIYVADRENGRMQWFDLQGRFLGERKYGGQFYNVTFDSAGQLWASVHPKGVSLDEEFNVVRIDNATGRILGRIEGRSHELGIGPDGAILPATRSGRLVVYRPRP
jgi:DNA-binding beta-propeller fold protein YncE